MTRIKLASILLSILALLSPFIFPWPLTLLAAALAAVFFPPIIILTGVLLDTLYFSGSGGLFLHGAVPYFTIIGIIVAIVAYIVQQFVKTRIIS